MKVPFLDLKAQHDPLREEIRIAIDEVIAQNAFAGGPFVEAFEEEFADYCGCAHAIGVGSGTEALWLALLALGVGPGDEVITVPSTFIATAEAITFCGALPRFVDIDASTYTMNPGALRAAITAQTKAIIPVDLFGQPAEMDAIREIAREHELPVLEDACQAHGAEYHGRKAGSLGEAGCFSFYPGKNLGAFGEAGAVVTNDDELANKIRILRDHGQVRKYHHAVIGWNGRMDGIQAAVLRVKLPHLDSGNELRRQLAAAYNRRFQELPDIVTPTEAPHARHVYHVYALRVPERETVMRFLGAHGVSCGVHYPVPVHLQPAYRSLGYRAGSLPVAERCAREFVSLPMFPSLSPEQLELVAQTTIAAVAAPVAA